MDDKTAEDYATCPYCPSVSHYFKDDFKRTAQNVARAKRELFHTKCRRCDEGAYQDDLQLCEWCIHLRPRHLLRCYSQSDVLGDITGVMLDPFLEESQGCDFCHFLAHHYRERFPGIDLYAESSTHGGFALHFPIYRSIADASTRDEIRIRHPHDYDFGNHPKCTNFNVNLALSRTQSSDAFRLSHGYQGFVHGLNWSLIRSFLASKLHAVENGTKLTSSVTVTLTEVRAIDVNYSCLTILPLAAQYAALSYVWGESLPGQIQLTTSNKFALEKAGGLSNVNLPETIADAIEACRRLGCRYLWVDRLCIVQDDTPERKSAQLDQMASIYHQAQFTIVALAGQDANYGLPGVQKPKSFQQGILAFSDFSIIESVPKLHDLINKSKWHTRGW